LTTLPYNLSYHYLRFRNLNQSQSVCTKLLTGLSQYVLLDEPFIGMHSQHVLHCALFAVV